MHTPNTERAESENVKLREIVEELAKNLEVLLKIAESYGWDSALTGAQIAYKDASEALRRAQELSKQEGNK